MKKIISTCLLSIVLASSSALFSSCQKQGGGKIHLDFGLIKSNNIQNITELTELKYNSLVSKINHGDSFLLAIYSEGCSCWDKFQPVLTQFYNETKTPVEYISIYEFVGKDELGLYLVPSDMPSIAVYEQGKLKIQCSYIRDDREMFTRYSKFKEFIDKNVYLPKMYYIEKDVLDSYITEDKEFNLYIARSACGDCNAVTTEVLYDWNKNIDTVNDFLYIFDIQSYYPIRPKEPDEPKEGASDEEIAKYEEDLKKYEQDLIKYQKDLEIYQGIKDDLGMSESSNPTLGFKTGAVPTFQRRKGSEINDMIVANNDEYKDDKIVSYFTESRVGCMPFLKEAKIKTILDGMDLTSEQASNWWSSYRHEFYVNYHYPIVRLFLNTYVK